MGPGKKPIACRIRSPCNEMSKSLVTRRGKKKLERRGRKKKNRTKISSNEPTLQLQTLPHLLKQHLPVNQAIAREVKPIKLKLITIIWFTDQRTMKESNHKVSLYYHLSFICIFTLNLNKYSCFLLLLQLRIRFIFLML